MKIERGGKSPREENRLCRLLICSAFTAACLLSHCYLISSPLPTTCGRNGSNWFFFFFCSNFGIGFLCKIVLEERDKIGFLRITSEQFGKFKQLLMVTWNALQCFFAMELLATFAIWAFTSQMKKTTLNKK